MPGAKRLAELALVLRHVRKLGEGQLGVVRLPGDDTPRGFLCSSESLWSGRRFHRGRSLRPKLGRGWPAESLVPLHHAVRRRLQVFDVDDRPQRVVADGWEGLADKLGELVGEISASDASVPPRSILAQ